VKAVRGPGRDGAESWAVYLDAAEVTAWLIRQIQDGIELGWYPEETRSVAADLVRDLIGETASAQNSLMTDAEKAQVMWDAYKETPWIARMMAATVLASSDAEYDAILERSIQDFTDQQE
jgi:hypothetical protein